MPVTPRRHWVLLGLLLTAACNDDSVADPLQALCELAISCPCSTPPYATAGACVADLDARVVEPSRDIAIEHGLTYDQGCMDRMFEGLIEHLGCEPTFTSEPPGCERCKIVHGDRPIGASCEDFGVSSDCAVNLSCIGDKCVDLCVPVPAGAPCFDLAKSQWFGACGDGLFCDLFATSTCLPRRDVGEPCGFDGCKLGLMCVDERCQQPTADDEPALCELSDES